jgi:hypothetical protein
MAPGPDLEAAREVVHQAAVAAGRDPNTIGMEGRLSWSANPEEIAQGLRAWERAGATHVSVNTMGADLGSVDDHLAALETAAEAAKSLDN